MSIENKLTYLNGTKQALKESINNIGGNIDNSTTFREYAQELDNIYDNLPKTTGEDTNLSLTTLKGKMNTTLKGDTQQDTYQGYNLFAEIETQTLNDMKITKTDNGYILNGTTSANTTFRGTITNAASTNKTICAKCDTAITNANVQIKTRNSSVSQLRSISLGTANTWVVDSGTFEDYYCDIYIKSGTTLNNALIQPMLLSGTYTSSTIPNYEPYVGGTASPNPDFPQEIEVVTGTQEVKVENVNLLEGIEVGDINAQSGVENSTSGNIKSTNYIRYFTDRTYYAVINGSIDTSHALNLRFYNQNKEYIGYSQFYGSGRNFTITKGNQVTITDLTPVYFRFRQTLSAGPITSLDDQVMITNINEVTYTPHQEQTQIVSLGDIELCKIGTYQDYLYKSNDKWYKKEYIGKVVLNGSETGEAGWKRTGTNTSGSYYFFIDSMLTNVLFDSNRFIGLSNIGVTTNAYQGVEGVDMIFYNNKEKTRLYANATKTMSVDDFKSWLNTNRPYIYYVLGTANDIEITNTSLIEQLNNIEKLMSYNGTTNISSSGNLSAILSVSAIKGE